MRKRLVITNNDYNETAVNPTVFEFDRLSGTGNEDEFFFCLLNYMENLLPLTNISFEYLYKPYVCYFSGDKRIASTIWKRWKWATGADEITVPNDSWIEFVQGTAEDFVQVYGVSLRRVYTALFAEYDPIMDYSLSEKENVGTKITTDSDSDVYGFNSTTSVPNAKSKITQQGTKNDNERVLERKGNIGATPQTMVESELRLRKQSFARFFFECLDEYFTTCAY